MRSAGTSSPLAYSTRANRVNARSPAAANAQGGGVFAYLANLTLESCTVTSNSTAWDGGGVAVFGFYNDSPSATINSSLLLTSTTLSSNRAENGGGGVALFGFVNDPPSTTIKSSLLLTSTTPTATRPRMAAAWPRVWPMSSYWAAV